VETFTNVDARGERKRWIKVETFTNVEASVSHLHEKREAMAMMAEALDKGESLDHVDVCRKGLPPTMKKSEARAKALQYWKRVERRKRIKQRERSEKSERL
jgi:hypothetical protein